MREPTLRELAAVPLCVITLAGIASCRRASEPQERASRVAGQRPPATTEEASRARLERQKKLVVAPAALPAGLPLRGKEGVDASGYPLQWVDRAALRTLLHSERYQELTRYFEELQSAFEANPRKEYWITDAAGAFDSGEAELLPLLDAWVAASPRSFAPYLARGTHRVSLGFVRRGKRWAADTHESDFAAMADAHKKALVDLEEVLSIRPKAVVALTEEIHTFPSGAELRRLATQAAESCPSCFLPRVQMMLALEPRWGGSYEAMAEFAKSAPIAKNPRFRYLSAFIDLDRASVFRQADKLDEALAADERACALGDYWRSLLDRALTLEAKRDFAQAERDITRANELRPEDPAVLFPLARIALANHRWEAAGQALLSGLRLEPTNNEGKRLFPHVVKGLVYLGSQHIKASRKDDALHAAELALALDTQSRDAKLLKSDILDAGGDVEKLQAAADGAPNDLRAHQALDGALARQRRFPEVVAMWTRYLEANPRDGQAHLERGGAFFQMGKRDEARADAKAACELGVTEGCAHAK